MDISIRKAVYEDALSMAYILTSSWNSAYKNIIPNEDLVKQTNLAQRTEMFKIMLQNPRGEFYIAFDAEKPCGEFMFCKSRDDDMIGYGEIVSIYAVEEYWDRGVGRKMMDEALRQLAISGYSHVFLWVFKDNSRARKFYEKFGFICDGTEKKSLFSNQAVEVRYIFEFSK